MGILEDVIKALERIPAWKRLNALPAEITTLQQRVAALEAKLTPAAGDRCPSCGAMTFKLMSSGPAPEPWGHMGARQDNYACSSCTYTDERQRDPG